MSSRSLRNRLSDSANIWPGFVDVLATLLIVIIFILMVFTVSQIYLSDAISGRDKALQNLKIQIDELSKILLIETQEKQKTQLSLEKTEEKLDEIQTNLQSEQTLTEQLQGEIAKKRSEIFVQEQNIIALSDQITNLLKELKIVANALETYEGQEFATLETNGLGERINKALANRINQLNILNNELDDANLKLLESENTLKDTITQLNEKNETLDNINLKLLESENTLKDTITQLNEKNENLLAINESLGLKDAGIEEQLLEIKIKNDELKRINIELSLRDEELQNQIIQYQNLTNDLIEINNSLGLKDASLKEQLDAIRFKNEELTKLSQDLLQKNNTIFNLRGKISELNNILSLSEERQKIQLENLELLNNKITLLEQENETQKETSLEEIKKMEIEATKTMEQVDILSNQIDKLQSEIALLNNALEISESNLEIKNLEIESLGKKLNKALTSKVLELQKYRSEFFGKLQSILGDRDDIKIVGDRFIFQTELLFDTASADLQIEGKQKLSEIGLTLKETTNDIPDDIDWIIMVEGHTDKRPIKTSKFPSNWELSTSRANSVLKLLLDVGFPPNRLAAAGFGEFYPISEGETELDYQQNRRIELKLTTR